MKRAAMASMMLLQSARTAASSSQHPLTLDGQNQSASWSDKGNMMPILQGRGEANSTGDPHVSLSRNIPLQLVIIIGAVVVFAMMVASLAWLCTRRSNGTPKGGGRRKNTWSPGGSSSIYTYGSSQHSSSSLTMVKDKSHKGQSAMSPISPMPVLKTDDARAGLGPAEEIKVPEAVATAQYARQRGWQLFDNPVPSTLRRPGDDVESAQPPPARRPSFIDRLLAHRADPSDSRLPSQLGVDGDNGLRSPAGKKSPGGALLTAISGSLHAWPNSLRNRDNAGRLAAVESDFEGTIGRRDGEIPMAKRMRKSEGRFACDDSTDVPTPAAQGQGKDQFSPLPKRLSALPLGTPHTPGLAGLGTAWLRGTHRGLAPQAPEWEDGSRQASFAQLQRQQAAEQAAQGGRWMQSTVDQWVERSRFADMPPPSRRGSSNSFLTVASHSIALSPKPNGQGLERVVSIRPHFAALTTLDSWLIQEEDGTTARGEDSIIEGYLVGGSQVSSDTDFDRKRGKLWEVDESLPPSYHSERNSSHRGSHSEAGTKVEAASVPLRKLVKPRAMPVQWGYEDEQLEEEKRQIDRRQKMLLKEKKRAARRLARQQQARAAVNDEGKAEPGQLQQQMHLVLDMDQTCEEKQRLRLEPSLQDFKAPLLSRSDVVVVHSRPSASKTIATLVDRPPARTVALSPPESPLTSASEGPVSRKTPGNFLVESARRRGSSRSGSQRSLSQGAILSMVQSPEPMRIQALVDAKKLPKRKHGGARSLSEKHSIASQRRSSVAV